MALLNEMTPEEIEKRLENDTSFGMMNDTVAADVIARDSIGCEDHRRSMIKYFLDKEKFGPWLPQES